MSIRAAIYNKVINDDDLTLLLASDPITNAPAIYETWAHESAQMPYIVQTHEHRQGNHFAKVDALAIFDIFTDEGTINAEVIRNELLKVFDQESIEVENEGAARFYYNRDQEITGEPEAEIVHWQIVFDVQYWRKNWIMYKAGEVIDINVLLSAFSNSLSYVKGDLDAPDVVANMIDLEAIVNAATDAAADLDLEINIVLEATLVNATTSAAGGIETEAIFYFDSVTNATTAASGSMSITVNMESTVNAATAASGSLEAISDLAGVVNATTDNAGSIALDISLAGSINAVTDVSGDLQNKIALSGGASAVTDVAAAMTLDNPNLLTTGLDTMNAWTVNDFVDTATVFLTTERAMSGQSIKWNNPASGGSIILSPNSTTYNVAVTPNVDYILSGHYWSDDDLGYTYISLKYVESNGTAYTQTATQFMSSLEWKRIHWKFRPTTSTIRIEFVIHNANIIGYIDNFMLELAQAGQTTPSTWRART